MPRPSLREQRREEIVLAYERALARHGLGGATIARVAEELGVAPGLVHHHFRDREDLVLALIRELARRFRHALPAEQEPRAYLDAYIDASLAKRGSARPRTAKAWVGLLAEAIRRPSVAELLRRALGAEVDRLERVLREAGLGRKDASHTAAGIVSSILGALVFGALMPEHARGFAAKWVRGGLRAALE